MKKNAFTLVELLVTISIMSIVLVLAIPSIAAITERNANKRYENYGETLITGGKLYTDSNAIDMFGYESDGCYDIKFEQLELKKLVKDIDYKDVTCADGGKGETYVKVRKLDGELKYQLSMLCHDKQGTVVYEKTIKSSDVLCDGKAPHTGPEITVSPKNTEGKYLSENETYKVAIKVHDDDGLLENNEVEYTWCKDASCSSVVSTAKLRYENKRETKTVNKKVARPKGDGVYYLKVKAIRVVDVFNNATEYEETFGPYKFDITPPVVEVKAYKRNSKGFYDGNSIGNAAFNPKKLTSDNKYSVTGTISSNYTGNYNGWLNKENYPYGVYYEIKYSDNIQVKDETWKYNKANQSTKNDISKKLDGGSSVNTFNKINGVIDEYLESDGYRNAQIVVRDLADNYVTVNLEAYLDKVSPTTPSISNPTSAKWVNYDFSLTLSSTDKISGIYKYQYAYDSTKKTWVDYENSNKSEFITTKFSKERNENVYIRAMDTAGNYSSENNTGIKIDKTKPNCVSHTDNNTTTWVKNDVYIYKGCQDTGTFQSGCEKQKYVEHTINYSKKTHTFESYVIKDIAGNEKECPSTTVNVYLDKDAPTCHYTPNYTTPSNANRYIAAWCEDGNNQSGCQVTKWAEYTGTKTEYSHDLPGSTIYDNAGNSAVCSGVTINILVDKTSPKCTNTPSYTSWTKSARSVQVGCVDNQGEYNSGCVKSVIESELVSTTKKTRNFSAYSIKDNAGNTVTCPAVSIDVLVDTTAPECTHTGSFSSWTSADRDVSKGCKDSHSGCKTSEGNNGGSTEAYGTHTVSDTKKQHKFKDYKIEDNVGNKTNCTGATIDVLVDKDPPTCSIEKTAINRTDGVSYTVTCSDSHSGMTSGQAKCAGNVKSKKKTATKLKETKDHYAYDAVGNKSDPCTVTVNKVCASRKACICSEYGTKCVRDKEYCEYYYGDPDDADWTWCRSNNSHAGERVCVETGIDYNKCNSYTTADTCDCLSYKYY